jgi:hypothetical protein
MRKFLLLVFCAISFQVLAAGKSEDEWQATTLSDETIANIQKSKYQYLTCITNEVKKRTKVKMDTRKLTDEILKACEKSLADVRETFIKEKVPEKSADRYMKMTRTQTARKVLKEMMLIAASRK